MMRKHLVPFVALLTAGTATLTACSSTPEAPAPARASASAGAQATAPVDGAAAGDLALLSGTAKSNSNPRSQTAGVPGRCRTAASRWRRPVSRRSGGSS